MNNVLALVAVLVSNAQVSKEDLMGKTPDQVLTMGHAKWYEFYIAKNGESTASMSFANHVYSECLKERTNRLATAKSKALRTQIESIRKEMHQYLLENYEIGIAYTGGGTMWTIIGAAKVVELETTLDAAVRPGAKPPTTKEPEPSASKINAIYRDTTKLMLENREDIEGWKQLTGVPLSQALNNIEKASARWANIVAKAKGWNTAAKKLLWRYGESCASLAINIGR